MNGSLTTVSLPDILRQIYSDRLTGELVLTRGEEYKQVYFETGNIVFAASNQPQDRIGASLLRQGIIKPDQFEQVMAQTTEGKRFGQALVEAGIMNERDVVTNITFQILDIIYSVFTWTTGDYEFLAGESRLAEELKLKLTTASIILEGVRRIEDFGVIRRGLGDLNRFVAPSTSPLLRMQTMTLKPLERQLLEMVAQPLDLLQILIYSNASAEPTLRALFGLISSGVLEQTAPPEVSRDTGKFELPIELRPNFPVAPTNATSQPNLEYSDDQTALRAEIDNLKARIRLNHPNAILDVPASASLEEINFAYLRLADRFHPDKYVTAPIEIRQEIDEVFRRVVQSFEYLHQRAIHLNLQRSTGRMPSLNANQTPRTTGAYPALPPSFQPVAPPPNRSTGGYQVPPLPGRQTGGFPVYGTPTQGVPVFGTPSQGLPAPPQNEMPTDPMSYGDRGTYWAEQQMVRRPTVLAPTGNADTDAAIADFIAYLNDEKAPLIVADSLSMLIRTQPPYAIPLEKVAEIVAGWAMRKSSQKGRPIHEYLVEGVEDIHHAEQSRVLSVFDPNLFYEKFVAELVTYCPYEEREVFQLKLGGHRDLIRR
jgi:hypothetical protein